MSKLTSFFAKTPTSSGKTKQTPILIQGQDSASTSTSQCKPSKSPTPLAQTEFDKKCLLDCCDLSKPTPVRLEISKESTYREYGKRKRYFQTDWLEKYKWLVLCKTSTKAHCQTCRHVIHSNIQTASKNGIEVFTSQGFNNWKDGARCLGEHNNSAFHRDCDMKLKHQLNSTPIDEQISAAAKVNCF